MTDSTPAPDTGPDAIETGLPILGQNTVERVAASWTIAGRALGFDHFSAEGDVQFSAPEDNLVAMAARLLELSIGSERILELVVATTYAPGCALLGQRFAMSLGRASAMDIRVFDLVAASAGLGAGLATAAMGPKCELVAKGVVVTDGPRVMLSPVLNRFVLKGSVPSPLRPFDIPRTTPAVVTDTFVAAREPLLLMVERALATRRPVLMSGPAGFGGVELFEALTRRRELELRVIDIAAVFDVEKGLPTDLMPQLHGEARLFPGIWLIQGLERSGRKLVDVPMAAPRFIEQLQAIDRPIVVVHEGPMVPDVAARLAAVGGMAHVEVEGTNLDERRAAWSAALVAGGVDEDGVEPLIGNIAHYSLGISQIANAAAYALQRAAGDAARQWARGEAPPALAPTVSDLSLAATTAMTSRLRQYGSRVDTRATWNDLVLPDEVLAQVKDLSRFARLREKLFTEYGFGDTMSYGRAMSAMFSGPSGTGKTMVAGLIARDLDVELYRVDLSRVVSKYIGETEERLGMLFSEATQVGAALLFDEADSMFGARTEIKSSNDRYANLEVNYLLQRLEDFDGVVILTTNFSASIDEAFLRRLRFRVQFPFPAPEDRARLWDVMLPDKLPVDEEDLDIDWMGKSFELSGGHIRNAALRAGMLAADADEPLTMRMLYDAAATEYRELGKLAPPYPFDDDW